MKVSRNLGIKNLRVIIRDEKRPYKSVSFGVHSPEDDMFSLLKIIFRYLKGYKDEREILSEKK